MKRHVGEDGVERTRIGELLERDRVKDRAGRSLRVDRADLVAQPGDEPSEVPAAAAHLQHTRGGGWKVFLDEGAKVHAWRTMEASK
jgi:hypothetical protein